MNPFVILPKLNITSMLLENFGWANLTQNKLTMTKAKLRQRPHGIEQGTLGTLSGTSNMAPQTY